MKGSELKGEKNRAIKAAKDLGYSSDVLTRIKNAKTDSELQRIMITARKQMFGDVCKDKSQDFIGVPCSPQFMNKFR